MSQERDQRTTFLKYIIDHGIDGSDLPKVKDIISGAQSFNPNFSTFSSRKIKVCSQLFVSIIIRFFYIFVCIAFTALPLRGLYFGITEQKPLNAILASFFLVIMLYFCRKYFSYIRLAFDEYIILKSLWSLKQTQPDIKPPIKTENLRIQSNSSTENQKKWFVYFIKLGLMLSILPGLMFSIVLYYKSHFNPEYSNPLIYFMPVLFMFGVGVLVDSKKLAFMVDTYGYGQTSLSKSPLFSKLCVGVGIVLSIYLMIYGLDQLY